MKGTGIPGWDRLSLALRLAQLHGGTIDAQSDGNNRAASFRLRLHVTTIFPSPRRRDNRRNVEQCRPLGGNLAGRRQRRLLAHGCP